MGICNQSPYKSPVWAMFKRFRNSKRADIKVCIRYDQGFAEGHPRKDLLKVALRRRMWRIVPFLTITKVTSQMPRIEVAV